MRIYIILKLGRAKNVTKVVGPARPLSDSKPNSPSSFKTVISPVSSKESKKQGRAEAPTWQEKSMEKSQTRSTVAAIAE